MMSSYFSRTPRGSCLALGILALLGASTLSTPERAAAQERSGTISGQVVNQGSGAFLRSAFVEVEGTSLSAVTNREGRFNFPSVRPGTYQVTVQFMGLADETQEVEVRAGERIQLEFSMRPEAVMLEGIQVSGLREGQAAALEIQRRALNIRNVVSSQAFGNVTDGNVGELLKRVPGVSYELGNGDVRYVSVRGVAPDLNSVTVDGNRMPQAYGQSNRAFNIDQVGINYIETVEVVKAPTPDMEGDFVGGAVNLVPRSAFDLDRRRLDYSLGANVNPLRSNDTRPSLSAGYSDVFGRDGNLGILLTGNYTQKFVPVDGVIQRWERSREQPAYMEHARFNEESKERIRYSLGLRSDYRLDTDNRFFVNLMYNTYVDEQFRREFRLDTGRNDARYSTITEDVVETTATEARMWHQFREIRSDTWTIQTGGTHTPGRWEVDYGLNYALSSSEYTTSPGGETEFRTNRSTRWRIDYGNRSDRGFPLITQLDDLDIYDFNNYQVQHFQERFQDDTDRIWGGELNIARHVEVGVPIEFKAGGRYRSQERDLNRFRRIYSVNTAGMDLNQFRWDQAPSSWLDGRYDTPPVLDLMKMYELFRSNPELFEMDESEFIRRSFDPGGNFQVAESILGGYMMATAQIGELSLIGGVRVERTEVSGEGINQDVTLDRGDPAAYSRERREGSYTNSFPSLHAIYRVTPRLQARASFSSSIGRPAFGSIRPGISINDDQQVVSVNNPELLPMTSRNWDAGVEYFFRSVGILSFNLFRKDLTNFIFGDSGLVGDGPDNGFEGLFAGYELRTNRNGGTGTVEGVELNYSQELSFLPGRWGGLGVVANFTQLRTEGTYTSDDTDITDELEGFVPRSGNLGISFQEFGFEGRILWNYRSSYLRAQASNPNRISYREPRRALDLTTKYTVRRGLAVYLDIANVFDVAERQYDVYRDRPSYVQLNGRQISVGISGQF